LNKLLVTISVVSHGQDTLLQNLLHDLSQTNGIAQVWVTHNIRGAQVKCPDSLSVRCYQLRNPFPKGFGANHNAAFAHCATEWFAVVNPDIRLAGDVFAQLIAQAMPEDVLLAPALLDPRTGQVAPNRKLPTPWEVIRRRLPGWKPVAEPIWFPGAFLLIRAEAFRQVGGFDERFYLYAEDVDLCARLRLAGGQLRYVPQVQVSHAAQRSSHVRWRYLRWHIMSLLRLWSSRSFWRYRALLRRQARAAFRANTQRPR